MALTFNSSAGPVIIIRASMTFAFDSTSHNGTSEDPCGSELESFRKPRWVPTQKAFDKLLQQMGPNREDAGKVYETVRVKLVRFFEWRGCDAADFRADQTLDRVMRRIDEGQVISNLMGYIYGVARLVLKEELRERERVDLLNNDPASTANPSPSPAEETDYRLACFDHCLSTLSSDVRELIIGYYQEEKHEKIVGRRELAERLGIPLNALRIRAHRIRKTLEECIQDCLAQHQDSKMGYRV